LFFAHVAEASLGNPIQWANLSGVRDKSLGMYIRLASVVRGLRAGQGGAVKGTVRFSFRGKGGRGGEGEVIEATAHVIHIRVKRRRTLVMIACTPGQS